MARLARLTASALLSLSAAAGAAHGQTPRALPVATSPPARIVYWASNEALAARLADVAGRFGPLPGIPADSLGGPPFLVFLAPDPARFDSLTGGMAPEWAGGVAMPEARTIVLPGYVSERGDVAALATTLRHELAHAGLHRWLRGTLVPRWFDEGYAQLAAGQLDLASAWQIRLAFALHRAPPLDSLRLGFPPGAARARLAYLLSATAVNYLVQESGEAGLREFLARWRANGDMESALRATYGVTTGQLEEDWTRYVRRRYGWALFLSQAVVFWAFAALVLVLLWFRRRRLNRAKMADLRATELPDRPAYWLGEEDPPPDPPPDLPPDLPPS